MNVLNYFHRPLQLAYILLVTCLYSHRNSIVALEEEAKFTSSLYDSFYFIVVNQPVHPTATTATAAKLTVYDVVVPKASQEISHNNTKINVMNDIKYPAKKK